MQQLSNEELELRISRKQAVKYLERFGAPLTYKTLCTYATRANQNPAFEKIDYAVVYKVGELKRYADEVLRKKLSPK